MQKPKQRKFLSNFIWGWFSNNRAIQGAKVNPWWVALIIVLVAICLPVFPIFILTSKSYGAQFLGSYIHNFDQNITEATVALREAGADFVVGEGHLLSFEAGEWQQVEVLETANLATPYERVYEKAADNRNQLSFEIYFTDATTRAELNDIIKDIDGRVYYLNTSTVVPSDTEYENKEVYAPSYLLLTSKTLYTKICNDDSATVATYTNFTADWKSMKVGTKLLTFALDVEIPEGMTPQQYKRLENKDFVEGVYKNWRKVYNKSYLHQKSYNVKMSCLLFFGIYAILTFVLGLLVFALTRGKRNMFNYLKFMDCQKIVWWASFAPALLSFIFGLLLTSFAQMLYIILLGVRVMWISMKQLKPQY